jgi:aminoglycoside 6'-N-acetyltransferase
VDVFLHGRLTTLRPAGAGDVELLVAWHADPEVSRYWDDETFTRAEMEERLTREDVEAWIVQEGDEPVGYLQVDAEAASAGGQAAGARPVDQAAVGGSRGLDMFLIPAARGRGLGPDAARAMTRHLLDQRGRRRVTVDPYAWNEGAVRAWERAGFVEVSRHDADEEHSAPWILMEFRG